MNLSDFEKFQSIQSFKTSCDVNKKNHEPNFARVVAVHLYACKFKSLLKTAVYSLLYQAKFTVTGDSQYEYAFLYSKRNKQRADYDNIIETAFNLSPSPKSFIDISDQLSIRQIFYTLSYVRKAWSITKNYRCSFIHRATATLLISKFMSHSDKLLKLISNTKTLVTFCDAHPYENLATQLAKIIGVKTITNQHGQYRILNKFNISPDAEAYSNFISDYMFCWGDATINEFIKIGINKSRFIKTGWLRQWTPPTKSASNSHQRTTFGVLLNGENTKSSNYALLNCANYISEKLSIPYIVKPHPDNNTTDYIDSINSNCLGFWKQPQPEFIESINFCIAHMTGLTIELLNYGIPIYLLDDGRLADVFRINGLSFAAFEEMLDIIHQDSMADEFNSQRFITLSSMFNEKINQQEIISRSISG